MTSNAVDDLRCLLHQLDVGDFSIRVVQVKHHCMRWDIATFVPLYPMEKKKIATTVFNHIPAYLSVQISYGSVKGCFP